MRNTKMKPTLLARVLRSALAVLVSIASLTLPLRTEALLLDAVTQVLVGRLTVCRNLQGGAGRHGKVE